MNEINVQDSIKYREPKPEKYFLCFGFKNFSQKDLQKFHITLIYFGILSNEALNDVKAVVNEFLRQGCYYEHQYIKFSEEDMFGRDKNIRVLLPAPLSHGAAIFKEQFQTLRDRTEKFQTFDDFPFNPHLSTDLHYFEGKVDMLYLCGRGYRVIESWNL